MGTSPVRPLLQVKWFESVCPGRQGEAEEHLAVKSPHPSHEMARTEKFYWCARCGAWTSFNTIGDLLRTCKGRPMGVNRVYSLKRLRKGLTPFVCSAVAPRAEYELEVV